MEQDELQAFSEGFLDAWNSQDVERVVRVYTNDVIYLDPNTRGEVRGADALRRYLTRLFEAWNMHWSFREGYVAADRDTAAVLWHASLGPKGSDREVEVSGMDLVVVEGGRIKRNEVYFDRALLAPLLAETAQAAA